MGLLNKFFILEYLNITKCLESISTLSPGAQSTVRIPIPTNIITQNNLKTDTCSLVQQKENNNYDSDKYKVVKLFENHQMRDLYNRKKNLDYWIEIIYKDLD